MDAVLTWLSDNGDALIVGTLVTVVGIVLASAIRRPLLALRKRVVKSWRSVNRWRRRLGIASKPFRAQELSRWEGAPLRVLDSTLFRWFEADPQAWCGCVRRVYDSHTSEAVRERAGGLLWVDKEASDLQVGDVFDYKVGGGPRGVRKGHVLDLRQHGDLIEVVTSANFSPNPVSAKWRPQGTHPVRVNRGWCPLDDCSYCSLDAQDFEALAEKLRAAGH